MNYQLSACAEMLFLDLPFIERVKRISHLGFGVEIWNWQNKNIKELIETGAKFTSMTGYISGNLTEQTGIVNLLESAEQSIDIAKQLNCPNLNLHGTGLDSKGLPINPVEIIPPEMWLTAVDTLTKIAKLGEKHHKTFVLENLNLAKDHPGTPFAKAKDTYTLVKQVNSPYLKMNLDLYHAQIGEGNLIQLLTDCMAYIGEIQVADVPGRQEPGTGEINYKNIAKAIKNLEYKGVIAMEAWASTNSETALARFKETFA